MKRYLLFKDCYKIRTDPQNNLFSIVPVSKESRSCNNRFYTMNSSRSLQPTTIIDEELLFNSSSKGRKRRTEVASIKSGFFSTKTTKNHY